MHLNQFKTFPKHVTPPTTKPDYVKKVSDDDDDLVIEQFEVKSRLMDVSSSRC